MGNAGQNGFGHRTLHAAASGGYCGAIVGGALEGSVRNCAPEARAAAGLISLPCMVVGAALGATLGGAADLLDAVEVLREGAACNAQSLGQNLKECGDSLNSMKQKQVHTSNRRRTSEGTAELPKEAAPLLLALVIARRARALTEAETFDRAAAFSVKCAMQQLTSQEVLAEAEVVGRDVITYVMLRDCYPSDYQETVEEAAKSIAREDPDACDAAWILCGVQPLKEWSKKIRKSLPASAAEVSPDLLTRALETKYREVQPSLVQKLQNVCPGGTEQDYTTIVAVFHAELPMSSFWKIWHLLQSPETPKELLGLTFDELAAPGFVHRFQGVLAAKPSLNCSGTCQAAENAETVKQTKQQSRRRRTSSAMGELRIEVLRAEALHDPEYRIGDMASSLFGAVGVCSTNMFPYAVISWGNETHQTRVVEAAANGCADFGESICFTLDKDAIEEFGSNAKGKIKVQVFDARSSHLAVRGDPLFGEGRLQPTSQTLTEGTVHTIKLKRDGENHGSLLLRFNYRAPEPVHDAPCQRETRPLVQTVKRLGLVLQLQTGIDVLLNTRPLPLKAADAETVRPMLEAWANQFAKKASELILDTSDDECIKQMATVCASVQMVVSACVPPGTSDSQIQGLSAAWIRNFMATERGGLAEVNTCRLWQLMEAGLKELKQPRKLRAVDGRELGSTPPSYWDNQALVIGQSMKVRTEILDAGFLNQLRKSATHACCRGRDGTFDVNRIIDVSSYRIENPITWAQYMNKNAELAARHKASSVTCQPLRPPVPAHMLQCQQTCSSIQECDDEMNEVYLWHATKSDLVDRIINEGFDERVCSLKGLFGAGLYFAEESCKSGQYAKLENGVHYFFLCRVILGRPHYATTSMNNTRRAPEGSDSVIANVGSVMNLSHRELIVYDRFQAYPEFLIKAII